MEGRLARLDFKHSHVTIRCDVLDEEGVKDFLAQTYLELEGYALKDGLFKTSFTPVAVDDGAPEIARAMSEAGRAAGVGPTAAVAGAIAEYLGEKVLSAGASWVVVENGGDIYLKLGEEKLVGVYAGGSEFSNKLALRVTPESTPLGVCTSSATVGPSVSLGEADSVTVVAESAPLADAAATAIANEVKGADALRRGLARAERIKGIDGALIIKGGGLATCGRLPELVKT